MITSIEKDIQADIPEGTTLGISCFVNGNPDSGYGLARSKTVGQPFYLSSLVLVQTKAPTVGPSFLIQGHLCRNGGWAKNRNCQV